MHSVSVKPLSDVGRCIMLGIDCTSEFVVKAEHRPDNLSLFFSFSDSREQLKTAKQEIGNVVQRTPTPFLCASPSPLSLSPSLSTYFFPSISCSLAASCRRLSF